MSPARIESILTSVKRVKEGQSLTVKQFQRLLGLMAAASNGIPFWPAAHEAPTVVAQDQGVFPEGKSFPNYSGHAAMPSCLRHMEETLGLESGPGVGSSWSPCNASDRRVPHRLGYGHEWPPCPRSVERSPSDMAYQLSKDASCASSIEIFPPRPERSPCVGAHRQHIGDLLYQSPERSAFVPLVQAGTPDPSVVPGQTPLVRSSVYSWEIDCGSRHTVETGAETRGLHPKVVK